MDKLGPTLEPKERHLRTDLLLFEKDREEYVRSFQGVQEMRRKSELPGSVVDTNRVEIIHNVSEVLQRILFRAEVVYDSACKCTKQELWVLAELEDANGEMEAILETGGYDSNELMSTPPDRILAKFDTLDGKVKRLVDTVFRVGRVFADLRSIEKEERDEFSVLARKITELSSRNDITGIQACESTQTHFLERLQDVIMNCTLCADRSQNRELKDEWLREINSCPTALGKRTEFVKGFSTRVAKRLTDLYPKEETA